MSPGDAEVLGASNGDAIMVCPLCSDKAWAACGCGWRQWYPPDDPDELRGDAFDLLTQVVVVMDRGDDEWAGLLAIGVDGWTEADALAWYDWAEAFVS